MGIEVSEPERPGVRRAGERTHEEELGAASFIWAGQPGAGASKDERGGGKDLHVGRGVLLDEREAVPDAGQALVAVLRAGLAVVGRVRDEDARRPERVGQEAGEELGLDAEGRDDREGEIGGLRERKGGGGMIERQNGYGGPRGDGGRTDLADEVAQAEHAPGAVLCAHAEAARVLVVGHAERAIPVAVRRRRLSERRARSACCCRRH